MALLIPRFRYTIITKKYELGSERTNYIIVYQYHAINEQNIHKLYTCCENKISAISEINNTLIFLVKKYVGFVVNSKCE